MENDQIEEGLGFAEFKCSSVNNMRRYSVERTVRGLNEREARRRAATLANREVRAALEASKPFTQCTGECEILFFGPFIDIEVTYRRGTFFFFLVYATVKSTGTLFIDCVAS